MAIVYIILGLSAGFIGGYFTRRHLAKAYVEINITSMNNKGEKPLIVSKGDVEVVVNSSELTNARGN